MMQALINQTKQTYIIYNQITTMLEILKNNLKNIKNILVKVFKIKIKTKNFIAGLLDS